MNEEERGKGKVVNWISGIDKGISVRKKGEIGFLVLYHQNPSSLQTLAFLFLLVLSLVCSFSLFMCPLPLSLTMQPKIKIYCSNLETLLHGHYSICGGLHWTHTSTWTHNILYTSTNISTKTLAIFHSKITRIVILQYNMKLIRTNKNVFLTINSQYYNFRRNNDQSFQLFNIYTFWFVFLNLIYAHFY